MVKAQLELPTKPGAPRVRLPFLLFNGRRIKPLPIARRFDRPRVFRMTLAASVDATGARKAPLLTLDWLVKELVSPCILQQWQVILQNDARAPTRPRKPWEEMKHICDDR